MPLSRSQESNPIKRPPNLIYSVDEWPPWSQLVILGLQQVSLIAIYLVFVVIVVKKVGASHEVAQSIISLGMIALGLGALLQAVWKGPIGSGYLAPPVFSAIYLQASVTAAAIGGLPLVYGMTMVAGLFESFLSRFLHRLRHIFPPVVAGVIVTAVGFEVGLIGAEQLLNVGGRGGGTSLFLRHFGVANLTLAAMIGFSVWGRGFLRLFCTLLGIGIGVLAAVPAGLISKEALAHLAAAPVFALPNVNHLSYAFDLTLVLPFIVAAIAAGLRTMGTVATSQQINDAQWQHPEMESIRGGVLADGLGCTLAGVLGAMGLSTSPSAVGASQASGATSRYIALAVAGWFFVLACLPKIAAGFLALPLAVVGGTLIFTGSFLIVGGIRLMTGHPLDIRKTFIIGVSLLLAVSHRVFPTYFQNVPYWLHPVTGSLLSMATVAAVTLNLIFRLGIRRTETISLEIKADPREEVKDLLQRLGQSWEVKSQAVERAAAVSNDLLELLRGRGLAQGPVTLQVSFDDLNLELVITYQGDLLPLPPHRPLAGDLAAQKSFSQMFTNFFKDAYPDGVTGSTRNSTSQIKLIFHT